LKLRILLQELVYLGTFPCLPFTLTLSTALSGLRQLIQTENERIILQYRLKQRLISQMLRRDLLRERSSTTLFYTPADYLTPR
jgi:hypothetical protein